jgi:deoxycytidylate deaminase
MAKLSTWSDELRDQLGAVIVLRNEIIATGYNRCKTHPLQAYYSALAGRPQAIFPHAEISALDKLTKQKWESNQYANDFHLMKVYIFRETQHGLGMSKPCEICTLALKDFRIKHIFYTSESGYVYEEWH